jgi:hypothetical protein
VSLKDVEWWLKRGQYVRFLREICPRKKHTPKIGANIGAITGILLIDTKRYRFMCFNTKEQIIMRLIDRSFYFAILGLTKTSEASQFLSHKKVKIKPTTRAI